MKINGTELIKLIGLPESDQRILSLFKTLGVDRPICDEFGMCTIELSEDLGLDLGFDENNYLSDKDSDKLYLNDMDFYDNCEFFPFGISINNSLLEIEKKITNKANYIDTEDSSAYIWMYQELGWLTVQFTDTKCQSVDSIYVKPYENPEKKEFLEIMTPTKR